jgi:hypothetical protein
MFDDDNREAVSVAANAAGIDPLCFDWMWKQSRAGPHPPSVENYKLTDDEWAVLQPICPSETRANAWSWREFLDVELWLRRPRSRLSTLENANAHRCRKRRAAERGHANRMLQSMRGLNGLAPSRKGELIDILTKCAKHGRRIPPSTALH